MRRPDFNYSYIPYPYLLNTLQSIQDKDCDWLNIEYKNYQGRDSTYRSRLNWNNERFELLKELMCRLQSFHVQIVLSAIDQATREAELNGRKGNFKLHIIFDGSPQPIVNII